MAAAAPDEDDKKLEDLAEELQNYQQALQFLDDQGSREAVSGTIRDIVKQMVVLSKKKKADAAGKSRGRATGSLPTAGASAASQALLQQFFGSLMEEQARTQPSKEAPPSPSKLKSPIMVEEDEDDQDEGLVVRTVSGAAPKTANRLRMHVHEDSKSMSLVLSTAFGSKHLPHLVNSELDFILPAEFASEDLSTTHRQNLQGHDAMELSRTRILELFDATPGTKLVPLGTDADGDCLLHAASIGMWGVHWERSVSLTGEKAEATGLNLFVEERSPMRTSLMLCRQYHHKTFFMAWVGEYISKLRRQQLQSPDSISEDEAIILKAITFKCPGAAFSCTNFHSASGMLDNDFRTAVQHLEKRHYEEASMTQNLGAGYILSKFLGPIHVYYSNHAVASDVEHFGGIYIPLIEWDVDKVPLASRRPLLLHGGKQHYTALVTIDTETTRIPLFVGNPEDPEYPNSKLKISPLPLRYFALGGDAWRGFSTSWVEEPQLLEKYLGKISKDTVQGETVHFLDENQFERHEAPILSKRIADLYLANLKRLDERRQQGKGEERSDPTTWWTSLTDTEQALLQSVDMSPTTHTLSEMETWLIENGREGLRNLMDSAPAPPDKGQEAAHAVEACFESVDQVQDNGTSSAVPSNLGNVGNSDADDESAPTKPPKDGHPAIHGTSVIEPSTSSDATASKTTKNCAAVGPATTEPAEALEALEEKNEAVEVQSAISTSTPRRVGFFGGGRPDCA